MILKRIEKSASVLFLLSLFMPLYIGITPFSFITDGIFKYFNILSFLGLLSLLNFLVYTISLFISPKKMSKIYLIYSLIFLVLFALIIILLLDFKNLLFALLIIIPGFSLAVFSFIFKLEYPEKLQNMLIAGISMIVFFELIDVSTNTFLIPSFGSIFFHLSFISLFIISWIKAIRRYTSLKEIVQNLD